MHSNHREMKKIVCGLIFLLPLLSIIAQEDDLAFEQIAEAPSEYNAATVIARTIEGLGFRYHWATEELRPEDLAFTPGNNGRNCGETLEHIYGLSTVIFNIANGKVNIRPLENIPENWEDMRRATLANIKNAADLFRNMNPKKVEDLEIMFERDGKKSSYPIWNMLNGPLADAIYHTGQIVSFRRSAGNPQPSGVNVFRGTHTHEH